MYQFISPGIMNHILYDWNVRWFISQSSIGHYVVNVALPSLALSIFNFFVSTVYCCTVNRLSSICWIYFAWANYWSCIIHVVLMFYISGVVCCMSTLATEYLCNLRTHVKSLYAFTRRFGMMYVLSCVEVLHRQCWKFNFMSLVGKIDFVVATTLKLTYGTVQHFIS